jgi:hypothetical protein
MKAGTLDSNHMPLLNLLLLIVRWLALVLSSTVLLPRIMCNNDAGITQS